VRAVIRNAYTDVIIDTLDLTDRTGQRFSKNWRVPGDPSGEGFYISIVTSVYSDSGYTTKNANYGDEENTYLVADREGALRGGGSGVDARTVRRIIQEEIAKIEKPEKVEFPEFPKAQEVKFDTVLSAIEGLKTALKPEKPEKVDFKPLYEALQSILSAINEKEVTEPTDISPILEKLGEKEETDEITRQEIVELLSPLNELISVELPKKIGEMLGKTTFGISLMPTTQAGEKITPNEQKQEEQKPFDISKLTL
jgi:hypothetical protein